MNMSMDIYARWWIHMDMEIWLHNYKKNWVQQFICMDATNRDSMLRAS